MKRTRDRGDAMLLTGAPRSHSDDGRRKLLSQGPRARDRAFRRGRKWMPRGASRQEAPEGFGKPVMIENRGERERQHRAPRPRKIV